MEVTIATIIILAAVGIGMTLFKSFVFKMKVRPEFDSKAVTLLSKRLHLIHDKDMAHREKNG
ncbi:MAG: hypothetical protein ACI8WB_000191 [Phenylobacterium sp.]|jgi:hypothetical protein